MVPREDFMTCTSEETEAEIQRRNLQHYSYIPVLDDRNRILGLYDAEKHFAAAAPDQQLGSHYSPLSEDILIGANASIFDFILQADTHPTNLVISGEKIAGLVSLSDIQQLPVRAALFALVTSLEMALGVMIGRLWPNTGDWLGRLSSQRQRTITSWVEKAQKRDGFVNELAHTSLRDKGVLVAGSGLMETPSGKISSTVDDIYALRNKLAHGDEYAATPEDAKKVCEIVRSIYQLKDELLRAIAN